MNAKKRITTLRKYDSLDTRKNGTFDQITKLVCSILNVPIAMVSLVKKDKIIFKSTFGFTIDEIDMESGLCSNTILGNDLYLIENAKTDARTKNNSLVTSEFGLVFYAGFPLKVKDGSNIGALCIIDKVPRTMTEAEKEILENFAKIVVEEFEVQLLVHEANKAQLEMNNMLKAVFESNQDAKTFIDTNLIIRYTNQTSRNFTKHLLGKEKQIGDYCLDYILPDYQAEFLEYFNRALKGEIVTIEKFVDSIHWHSQMFPVYDNYQKLIGIVHNVKDITSEKAIVKKLTKQNKALRTIAWQQSHQVRQPLTNILSMCHLIKEDTTATEDEKVEYLDFLTRSTLELDKVIHDIISKSHEHNYNVPE